MLSSSLTIGWVYRLQMLLVVASEVILRSEIRGTHDYILLSQIRNSPILEGQVPVFISPRKRVTPVISLACPVGPRYITLARTAYKTPRPLLLRQYLLPRKRRYRAVT
jgi:hypothetical protein